MTLGRLVAAALLVAAGARAQAEPAAWIVSSETGGTLRLLGSIHYLRDGDHPLPRIVDTLYAEADTVVMEIDLDDLDPRRSQETFLGAAALPAAQRLADVLPSDLYERAGSATRAMGIDLATLERFEPWLVAITIMDLGMSRLGFRPERGIEQYLLGRARADGKPVLGLETIDAQVAIFDSLTMAEQRALLDQTLHELATADAAMGELIDAWRRGELESLTTALMDEFREFPRLYEALAVRRNGNWIDELERLLEDGNDYLVVVGALHLVGRDSVIDLLGARGYAVARLD